MAKKIAHDILDREDKSVHPLQGRGKQSKIERYKWANQNAAGIFAMVSKHDLIVDGRYQREEVSKHKIAGIARHWDWILFGALAVAKRGDGKYAVLDGGHRVRASFYRSDIVELPCMIFNVGKVQNEAKAFLGANFYKSTVKAYNKFIALITAKDPDALYAQQILGDNGYRVVPNHPVGMQFRSISVLMMSIYADRNTASECFRFFAELAAGDGEKIKADIFRGLSYLVNHFKKRGISVLEGPCRDKLASIGIVGLSSIARDARYESGKGGALIVARAFVGVINKGKRRNRLKWNCKIVNPSQKIEVSPRNRRIK